MCSPRLNKGTDQQDLRYLIISGILPLKNKISIYQKKYQQSARRTGCYFVSQVLKINNKIQHNERWHVYVPRTTNSKTVTQSCPTSTLKFSLPWHSWLSVCCPIVEGRVDNQECAELHTHPEWHHFGELAESKHNQVEVQVEPAVTVKQHPSFGFAGMFC